MSFNKIYTALTIAGSDSSGGAGIQADIKTMIANGVYGMSAITALTAQNTMGVSEVMNVTPEFLQKQIDAVFEDIFPDAVKIGMVSNAELAEKIADRLEFFGAKNIVTDPVMVSTSGSKLMENKTIEVMNKRLFPISAVITPNIPEAEILSGIKILSADDMKRAAEIIGKKCQCAVLLKGGHSINDANDLLYENGCTEWFYGRKINNPNTHGTGCTLSSAIASNLAKGFEISEAVKKAKEYISDALSRDFNLGKGSGPLCHGFVFLK